MTGASTIPPILIERMRRELGIRVVTTAYGLTECGGLATICDPDDDAATIAGTSGKAIPGTEVCIVDPTGQPLPPGEPGEICLRGFHVMKGCFNENSGGHRRDHRRRRLAAHRRHRHPRRAGYLRITDRLKDMFIVGGFNCYRPRSRPPSPPTRRLPRWRWWACPTSGWARWAAPGAPPRRGAGRDGLIAGSRANMANYKVPRYVRFFDAPAGECLPTRWPRTNCGPWSARPPDPPNLFLGPTPDDPTPTASLTLTLA